MTGVSYGCVEAQLLWRRLWCWLRLSWYCCRGWIGLSFENRNHFGADVVIRRLGKKHSVCCVSAVLEITIEVKEALGVFWSRVSRLAPDRVRSLIGTHRYSPLLTVLGFVQNGKHVSQSAVSFQFVKFKGHDLLTFYFKLIAAKLRLFFEVGGLS